MSRYERVSEVAESRGSSASVSDVPDLESLVSGTEMAGGVGGAVMVGVERS